MNEYTGTPKTCPRCGQPFVCMHDTPAVCQCAGIKLSAQARTYLRTHYTDCLCARCLRVLEQNLKLES
ncbi:MAG: cysteine-rich CWC family protein [Paludibacteraceae bacterium]|nr:cysteine-rich CWC family protein [Paludibacteraceae bacterium]